MTTRVPLQLAIIGAGPFGLSAAAMAKARGLDFAIFGKPMELWRRHMPERMLLRSDKDWHLDPGERYTLASFLASVEPGRAEATPIPIERFLEYASWFREQAGIDVDSRFVTRLTRGASLFDIELEDGERVSAQQVLCAPGVRDFRQIPAEYTCDLPSGRWLHSTDVQVLDRSAAGAA